MARFLAEEAGVGDAFDDAFAVFVAGALIAAFEGAGEAGEFGVGFVDDHGGMVGPFFVGGFCFVGEGDVAVEGLFHEKAFGEEEGEVFFGLKSLPKLLKGLDLLEVFVAVEGIGEMAGGVGGDELGEGAEAGEVVIHIAGEFYFEMGEAVSLDAVFEGLGEAVI